MPRGRLAAVVGRIGSRLDCLSYSAVLQYVWLDLERTKPKISGLNYFLPVRASPVPGVVRGGFVKFFRVVRAQLQILSFAHNTGGVPVVVPVRASPVPSVLRGRVKILSFA